MSFLVRNLLVKNAFQINCFVSIKAFSKYSTINGRIPMKYYSTKSTFLKDLKLQPIQLQQTSSSVIHGDIPALQELKKRQQRKKRTSIIERSVDNDESLQSEGFYNVTAYATAEEYDLESLLEGLEEQDLYVPKKFFSTDNLGAEQDVLYVTAKYQIESEPRDIFFFREGSVVLWNCNEDESNNILQLIRRYEKDRYMFSLVKIESETMPYTYIAPIGTSENSLGESENHHKMINSNKNIAQFKNGKFYLTKYDDNFLEKYTFSNALTASIKLGIWEAKLNYYINSMEFITEDLKNGRKIRINRSDLLRKTGELFALRHLINLSSDLLDIPDFYWDREELEQLYLQVCNYFSITRRTKVMNEKLNHCIELAELVSSHLNDAHHVRLEWMIIILIMVEVGFEILHYAERYYSTHNDTRNNVNSSNDGNNDNEEVLLTFTNVKN